MSEPCEPGNLATLAKCFTCFEPGQQAAIQTYLLCQISGMACDPQTLMTAAACFLCLNPTQLAAINTYLLCQIFSGGGTGGSGITCGTSDPVAAPAGTCGIYYRTDNGAVWFWNGVAWVVLIYP